MEPLLINPSNETPRVLLDGGKGTFSFSGKSYPENVNEFYTGIINYLQSYAQNPSEKTVLEFSWLYFNTATAKMIVKIIMELNAVKNKGKSIEIKWICKSNDDLMIEKGEELQDLLGPDFKVVHA